MDCRLVVTLGGVEGETYTLREGMMSVGRDSDNEIQFLTDRISRHHARFINLSAICRVEDLNSTNGTFINGKKITSYDLRNGDEVTIGNLVLRFEETTGWDGEGQGSPQRQYSERSQMATVMVERRSESALPGAAKDKVSPLKMKTKSATAPAQRKIESPLPEKSKTQPISIGNAGGASILHRKPDADDAGQKT